MSELTSQLIGYELTLGVRNELTRNRKIDGAHMSDTWTLYCSSVCFSSVLKHLVYIHFRKIGRKIGQETERNLICEAPPLKKSNGIKYITRRSPQILNTGTLLKNGTYRKIFGDFSLAQMGDCIGIFNRPSDFSLVVGDWASRSLFPCIIIIINLSYYYNQLQYPDKERHLKGMVFVDLFLFICISLFYLSKLFGENETSILKIC